MKLHGDFGPRLVRLLRFDEESALIDVASELREHLIDRRVIDANGDASPIRAASILVTFRRGFTGGEYRHAGEDRSE